MRDLKFCISDIDLVITDLNNKIERYRKLNHKMAKLLMDLGSGNDVHDQANRLVKKHFPDIYKKYE